MNNQVKRIAYISCSTIITLLLFYVTPTTLSAKPSPLFELDTVALHERIFFINGGWRTGRIWQHNNFLKGNNIYEKSIRYSNSFHASICFKTKPGSFIDRVYGAPYQGLGFGYFIFNNIRELGNPWSVYFLQGGRIKYFSPKLSLWYKWNFGISGNWNYFQTKINYRNTSIGSKLNAYINIGMNLNYDINPYFDLVIGANLTHFSNGNTNLPNEGLNILSGNIGINYFLNKTNERNLCYFGMNIPHYVPHMMYEIVVSGTILRKQESIGTVRNAQYVYSTNRVGGISFAPMYGINHRFRFGASLDITYNEGRDLVPAYINKELIYVRSNTKDKWLLGLGGRTEYVMPYFVVSFTLGYDFIQSRFNDKRFYQKFAIKIDVYKDIFLYVGYRLENFHIPNFLMLGAGYVFNKDYNKTTKYTRFTK